MPLIQIPRGARARGGITKRDLKRYERKETHNANNLKSESSSEASYISSDITVEPPSEEDVANAAQFRLRKLWAQEQWEHYQRGRIQWRICSFVKDFIETLLATMAMSFHGLLLVCLCLFSMLITGEWYHIVSVGLMLAMFTYGGDIQGSTNIGDVQVHAWGDCQVDPEEILY